MLPAQPNESLIDGLACLQAVASAEAPVGTRELARRLGLEPTRTNRLVKTLAHLEFIQQGTDRRYSAGPGIHVMAAQALYASGLLRRAFRPLESLRRFDLIVALGVLWRDQVAYLYHALPGMPAPEAVGRVGLYPASRSGVGLPLLAHRSPAEIRALYADREIPGYGRDRGALASDLVKARRDGFAYVEQDRAKKIWSLGVVIGAPAYAAIALSGRIAREKITPLARALHTAARAIEATAPEGTSA